MLPTFMRAPELTGIVRTSPINKKYIHTRVFPFMDCAADELTTWIELDQNPMAPFVSIDAETAKVQGDIYGKLSYSVAYVRNKAVFKQSDIRIFEEVAASQNSVLARMQFGKQAQITKAVRKLSENLDARLEWMAIEALTGQIDVSDGGVIFTINYPGPFTGTAHKRTPGTLWDASGGDPIADLLGWIEEVGEKCGTDPSVMVCSRKVIRMLSDNAAIRQLWFTGQAGFEPTLTPPFVIDALKMAGINEVIIYDAKYTTTTRSTTTGRPAISRSRYLANTDILLLPATPVGNMRTAPGPDGVQTGKFAWNKEEIDPWIVEAGAGIYAIPEITDLETWLYATVIS